MAQININDSGLGNALTEMLTAPDIEPGDQPSYELCKILWSYHPLGKKMVEGPIAMAQQQPREISIPDSPEDLCREAFLAQWDKDRIDEVIYNTAAVARAYGISSLAVVGNDLKPEQPLDFAKLADTEIAFSVFDPLNTAGSLVLNQNPNSIDFMKVTTISVSGQPYHRSKTVTLMNEHPIYILYTTSAFGFVGRSVFQRALYPLKSFVQTMITDDLVTKKAGVFIAKLKTAGSIIDAVMARSAGLKRLFIKEATVVNANVVSIGIDEMIETLNMQNIDGAFGNSRKNILENIATAADMPAIILKQETFAEGFGEGTEDSKMVAGFISSYRRHVSPLYMFMDRIIQRRAWNKNFFKRIQNEFPEYKGMRYEDAFYKWTNSFKAVWPNMLQEPDSEKVKWDDVKLKAIIATVEVFGPMLDPDNKAELIQWATDCINENKMMFQSPLNFDVAAIADFEAEQREQMLQQQQEADMAGQKPPKPFAATDAFEVGGRNIGKLGRKLMRRLTSDELTDLVEMMGQHPENLPEPRRLPRSGGHVPRLPALTAQASAALPSNDWR